MVDVSMRKYATAFGLGLLGSWGCLAERTNTDHCAYLEGDATCEARYSGERPFCQRGSCGSTIDGDGCVAARPDDEACYSPCGGGLSLPDDASCRGGESTSTSDDSSTSDGATTADTGSESGSGESSTTGSVPCMGNGDCMDAAAPFCEPVSGECVACDGAADPDTACVELDPGMPLCVGGACVQCTAAATDACTGATPVCDDTTNTCVPCTAHDQCGQPACNLFTGACLPVGAVVHVGPGQTFMTLGAAVDSFAAGAEGTIVVHGDTYNEAVTVDGGRVLAFLANDGDLPLWILAPSTSPQLEIGDATVLMDGIQISGNASSSHPGIRVNAGQAWLDRSQVTGNDGGGMLAEAGAELVLRNCFVGDGTASANALAVDSASADVLYTTLGTGFDNFGDVFSIQCTTPVDVVVRNSVLVSFDNAAGEISCATADVINTASETLIPGTGNVALGAIQADWFVDVTAGNFLLDSPPASIATTATWEAGDPPTDIQGDSRPQLDGAPDVAGADVP